MDILRALHRYRALLSQSAGFTGKLNAARAIYYYTVLRFNLWAKSKNLELRVGGHRLEIDQGRKELASVLEVLLERSYEPDPGWVPGPGDIVFDIGANIGVFTLMQAARVGTGRVYAFEPSPTTYSRLARNVALNSPGNVESLQQALGQHPGRVRFVDKPISLNSAMAGKDTREPTVEVEVGTLDAFVAGRGIRRIDLMKIDTEGHEIPVLSGGEEALKLTHRLVLEIHQSGDEAPLRRLLEQAGLRLTHRERELLFFERGGTASEATQPSRAADPRR